MAYTIKIHDQLVKCDTLHELKLLMNGRAEPPPVIDALLPKLSDLRPDPTVIHRKRQRGSVAEQQQRRHTRDIKKSIKLIQGMGERQLRMLRLIGKFPTIDRAKLIKLAGTNGLAVSKIIGNVRKLFAYHKVNPDLAVAFKLNGSNVRHNMHVSYWLGDGAQAALKENPQTEDLFVEQS